mmetsp:Transcript_13399/g.33730  ORF Transcript_13399/g.33730 Transcript_13399/m.33730 type:complete len:902 (+) Transcript_13399:500-3205(+)
MANARRRISEPKEVDLNFEYKTMNPDAQLRPELKEKIEKWILSFYHLDPRYKILTFFNFVASEGADNVTDDSVYEYDSSVVGPLNGSTTSSTVTKVSNNGPLTTTASGGESKSSGGNESPKRENYRVNSHLMQRPSARHIRPSTLSLLSSLFNTTSILTVWRPCSNDAMRKMMEGTGVGKGLDIKGKSAKKGILSAFVPFMQIFNNDHKGEIQPLAETAEMRIYYKHEDLRNHVFEVLDKFRKEGPKKDSEDEEMNGEDYVPQHKDPDSPSYLPETAKLKKIKRYHKKGYWGIECSQRLFWYGTIQDADISRAGTGTETGRPSLPGFQDANHKTLKVAQAQLPKPQPMPVVLQHKTLEDVMKEPAAKQEEAKGESSYGEEPNPLDGCLDPRYLVMAYEEQGTIKPVVSDFDGFLLGWRREALWFGCNLPRDQEALMMWCVDHIEEILDDQKANPTNSDTWTIRWLDVMKNAAAEGFHCDVPEYGFGDPKSTSIMEHAALKLKSTGAVRHGSECFNYNFPQEIDEMFLLISDTLKPVPWKYVNVKDLQTILSAKISEGFVFPLNPKWILCDPGWKKIYDELMASDALYADLSKDVWFPIHTGIRDRIEKICKRHPHGFQRCTDPSIANRKLSSDKSTRTNISGRRQSASNLLRETLDEGLGSELTGNAFADLAQLELDDFVGRTSIMPQKKRNMQGNNSLTIDEIDEDDQSSSEHKTRDWRTPSKNNSRSNFQSHKSTSSSTDSKLPNSGRSDHKIGFSSSHSSTASTGSSKKGIGRAGRRMLSRARESTRKMIVPKSSSKGRHRATASFDAFCEKDEDYASAPNLTAPISPRAFPEKPSSLKKFRNISAPEPLLDSDPEEESTGMSKLDPKTKMENSKVMNREPRRHFSKWDKIKRNLKSK